MGYLGRIAVRTRSGTGLTAQTQSKNMGRQLLLKTLYGQVATRRRRLRKSAEIRSILVIRPDHLGDLLFATPALEELRKAFPQAHITGLVGPWGAAMWEDNPNLDALEIVPFPGISAKTRGRHPLSPYRLLGEVARSLAHDKYDLGLTLRFDHWWGAALMWAAGIPRRWGYDTPGMGIWLTNTVPYVAGRHEVEQNIRLAQEVTGAHSIAPLHMSINRDMGVPALRPPLPVAPPDGLLGDWVDASRRIVIHPGTGSANKLWTIAGWSEVADKLAAKGWAVVLTGAPAERELAHAVVPPTEVGSSTLSGLSGSPLNGRQTPPRQLAGKTNNVGQLVWVLERAHMVLGVDSGPLHIAAALGKPTLHLYGPSDETIWGPWGSPYTHRVLRAPGTQPTSRLDVGSRKLEGGPEMRAITADMVMIEIHKLFEYAEYATS